MRIDKMTKQTDKLREELYKSLDEFVLQPIDSSKLEDINQSIIKAIEQGFKFDLPDHIKVDVTPDITNLRFIAKFSPLSPLGVFLISQLEGADSDEDSAN